MLKRLSLYTFLLCLVPIFVWIFSWKWNGDANLTQVDYPLFLLTETGTSTYVPFTCILLALLFYPVFPNRKKWIYGVIIMALCVAATTGLKIVAKNVFAEPRPFVMALTEQSGVSTDYFYDQPRKVRKDIISQFYVNKPETPEWLVEHRRQEVTYSFPSGHTIFVTTWLLLAVGFTEFYGRCRLSSKLLVAGILIWGILMQISRLRLGVHHPVDLFTSILIAWFAHCIIFWYLQKKTIFVKE